MPNSIHVSCRKCNKHYTQIVGQEPDKKLIKMHKPMLLRIFRRHLRGEVTKLDGTKEMWTFCRGTDADMIIEVHRA